MRKIIIKGLTCPNCGGSEIDSYLHTAYGDIEYYLNLCKDKCMKELNLLLTKRIFFGMGNTENLKENPPYESATTS
jgi:hypothetical protein